MKSDSSHSADSAEKSPILKTGPSILSTVLKTGSLGTGAEIAVQALIDQGVDTMFGYPGGVILPFFDKLYDAPIRFIIPRHEQGGAHMADGYALASGKVGVIVATSGPGACNLDRKSVV